MDFSKSYTDADWSGSPLVTAPIALNWRGGPAMLAITKTETIDYDVQVTNSDLQAGATANWITHASGDGLTASALIGLSPVPRFMRILVNSETDATLTLDYVQSDV